MNKNSNSTIWIIASLCSIIVLTALGVITSRLVQQSRTKIINETEAYKQGRIRIAMYRLDLLAATLIRSEDERSVYEFKNYETQQLPEHLKQKINSLYTSNPEFSKLYWNLRPSKPNIIISPQVYTEGFLTQNNLESQPNTQYQNQLHSLEKILSSKLKKGIDKQNLTIKDNKTLTYAVAKVSLDKWGMNQNRNYYQDIDFSYKNQAGSQQEIIGYANKPEQQAMLSQADRNSRVKAVSRVNATKKASAWNANYEIKEASKNSQKQATTLAKPLPPITLDIAEEPFSTPFTPLWLNGELMLVRKVTEPRGDSVQGIWLDSEKLISMLLAEIEGLFPDAKLAPITQDLDYLLGYKESPGDPTMMVKFPLQLIPNEPLVAQISTKSYILGPIGLAWLATFIAILAGYFMLKSVLNMSERRASFVSSVTHELRTPLTTFRLYSDLLSTGMVTDPEKQKDYLDTLKHESERLTHLVENVLSYSQIERGSAKAKVEKITLVNLIERMKPRLSERAQEVSFTIHYDLTSIAHDESVTVDITAVEQIIFNLIDNACKYADGDDYGEEIQIRLHTDKKHFTIEVSDQGPGINPSEAKRLFKPFHKSAKQAADTKPGVGLGLALCRRLAKAMKGNLTISHRPESSTAGACFQLKLPKA